MTNVIETSTTWTDSGYDCDHCGGRVLLRVDHETGQPDRSCFQCEQCSCQWSLDRRPLRVGNKASCRNAQQVRDDETERNRTDYLRWVVALGVAALSLLLLRFGGGAALRLLIPALLVAVVVFVWMQLSRNRRGP